MQDENLQPLVQYSFGNPIFFSFKKHFTVNSSGLVKIECYAVERRVKFSNNISKIIKVWRTQFENFVQNMVGVVY